MSKRFACGAVVPDCPYMAKAESEQELLQQVAAHAAEAHGIKEISPELLAKVKSAIREG